MGKLLLVVVRTEWMAYAGHERLFVTDRFRTAKICAYRTVCRSLDSALGDAVRAQIRADTPPRHATRMPTIRELASGDSLHESRSCSIAPMPASAPWDSTTPR